MDNIKSIGNSQYSGSYSGLLRHLFLATLLSIATVGIAVPWAIVLVYRWVVGQAQVDGKSLHTTGTTGKALFKVWSVVWIVTAVVIAIVAALFTTVHSVYYWPDGYQFLAALGVTAVVAGVLLLFVWFGLQANRILVAHTHYEKAAKSATSTFNASYGAFLGQNILYMLRLVITLFIGVSWATDRYMSWWADQTKIDSGQLHYTVGASFLRPWMAYWIGFAVLVIAGGVLDSAIESLDTFGPWVRRGIIGLPRRIRYDVPVVSVAVVLVGVMRFLWDAAAASFVLGQVVARLSKQKKQPSR